jgi:hypothetical protein
MVGTGDRSTGIFGYTDNVHGSGVGNGRVNVLLGGIKMGTGHHKEVLTAISLSVFCGFDQNEEAVGGVGLNSSEDSVFKGDGGWFTCLGMGGLLLLLGMPSWTTFMVAIGGLSYVGMGM